MSFNGSTLDLVSVFRDLGMYIRPYQDKHHVKCPNEHLHGSKTKKEDSYIRQEANGPRFQCSHNACSDFHTNQAVSWAESQSPGIIEKHGGKRWNGQVLPVARKQKSKPSIEPHAHNGERKPLPTEIAETNVIDALERLFEPDEFVCITWEGHDGKPSRDEIRTLTEWTAIYSAKPAEFSAPNGVWYCINPLINDESRGNDRVKAFRRTLLEGDAPKQATPEERQRFKEQMCAFFESCGLPIEAIYDSAGKSIHAVVRIDASNEAEFKERVEKVYAFAANLPGLDKGRKSSAQLSRLPGAFRDDVRQALLSWNVGAASFDEWADSVEPSLFEIENPLEWTDDDVKLPPVLIEGWLYKSHLGMLTGSMKTNKSWTLLELAICFAMRLPWLGRQCSTATVLYIDAEIQRPFWKRRASAICVQKELKFEDVMRDKRIRPAFVAGKNVTAGDLSRELERLFEKGALNDVDVIIIDPIYQFYDEAWEENGNSDISKLGKILRYIAELTGISILFAHHHTKGNQDGKRDIEKASGGGAFGRFVASSLAITLIDEESRKYTLGWTTTNFKPSPKQVAYRDEFEWRITEEDPKEAVKNHRTIDDIMAALPDDGLSSDSWLAACRQKFEITDDAFEYLRPRSREAGRTHFVRIENAWKPTVSELEKRSASLTATTSSSAL
jgi:RecA-family ATPase